MTVTVPLPPTAPDKYGSNPAAFDAAMQNHLAWQEIATAQMNAQNGENNAINANVNTKSAEAAVSAASAASSANSAALSSGAVLWVSGTTYLRNARVISPADRMVYRRNAPGAGTTDPSLDSTNWRPDALEIETGLPAMLPTLLLDFANSRTVDPRITFTRASTAMYCDSDGGYRTAAANEPRIDFDPATGECLGLLVEGAATNLVRNSMAVGAGVGSPGVLPNNWNSAISTGLSRAVVATGTERGVSYVDVRFFGTNTSGALGICSVLFDGASAAVPAVQGQVWTPSVYLKVVGGSLAGLSQATIAFYEKTAAMGYVRTVSGATALVTSSLERFSRPADVQGALTAFVDSPQIFFSMAAGASIDVTLRIGLPQFESGAVASSVIPTVAAQVTRSADVAQLTGANFSRWFRADEGTLLGEFSTSNTATSSGVFGLDNGTQAERLQLRHNSALAAGNFLVSDGDVVQAGFSTPEGSMPLSSPGRAAAAYRLNDFALCANGGTVVTDNEGTLPTVNQALIGSGLGVGSINGHVRRIAFWPRRLSNSVLRSLTA